MSQRIKATRRGTWKLELPEEEKTVLRSLAPQLRAMLIHATDDPDLRRLFPTAYVDDPDADAFFKQITHDDLLASRLGKIDLFEAALSSIELDEAQLSGFMAVCNDLRLVLGTKLNISEDDDPDDYCGDPVTEQLYAIFVYLGWMVELAVDALFGTVPD